jgi:hypothetical protein
MATQTEMLKPLKRAATPTQVYHKLHIPPCMQARSRAVEKIAPQYMP